MIISIHIPKTAGNAFKEMLTEAYGERVRADYGDWVGVNTPEAIARREARTEKARANKDELLRKYDIIHGHFKADKYMGLFPRTDLVAFFRDPYQQAISNTNSCSATRRLIIPGCVNFTKRA